MQLITNLKHILRYNICTCGLIILILFNSLYIINNPIKSQYNINTKQIKGTIIDVLKSDSKTSYTILGKEKIIANDYNKSNYEIGDIVHLTGKIKEPSSNTNFNLFNYKNYLLGNKIYYTFTIKNHYLIDKSNLYNIKNKVNKYIERHENSDYLKAFILGNSKEIDPTVKESYTINGVNHLLAISGMHISLISLAILKLINRFFNKKVSYILTSIILIFYLFLVGFTPSAVRAVLLFVFLAISYMLNKKIPKIKSLIWCLLVLLLYNPYYIYNIGFIFSFTISAFLILFSKVINKEKNYIKKVFLTSVIAFLSSLPILINLNFEFNLISPFLNIIFVPLVSIIIFPLALITLFFPVMNCVLSFFTNSLEILSLFFTNISLNIIVGKLNIWFIIIYYLVLIIILTKFKYKKLLLLFLLIIIFKYSYKFINYPIITMLDQTTPNMIQGISGIYERNPLISKGILPFLNFKWFRKGSFFMPGFKESKKLATIIQ